MNRKLFLGTAVAVTTLAFAAIAQAGIFGAHVRSGSYPVTIKGKSDAVQIAEATGADKKAVAPRICPVMKMPVKAGEGIAIEHNGKTYYFCCAGCVEKFKQNPAAYLEEKSGG
ncbi:MAG TPA: YHS domain-containing protein [Candidatus Bathyarchaeia archaeon]|nr:YHS domain-containing protein [Candidatus Bathyarchaeia archaeon]